MLHDRYHDEVRPLQYNDQIFHGYWISSVGRVYSSLKTVIDVDDHNKMIGTRSVCVGFSASRILKTQSTSTYGHKGVGIRVGGRSKKIQVHRAVLCTFGPPRPSHRHNCGHRDDDPTNNDRSNLLWQTHEENNKQRAERNRSADSRGSKHPSSILNESGVLEIRSSSMSCTQLAVRHGVARCTIDAVKKRRTWKHI